jgi:hypothetical protein
VASHTGKVAHVRGAVVDEHGRVYLDTDIGFGVVHTLDMEATADAIEQKVWRTQEIGGLELPLRFGFVRSPTAARTKEAATG